MTARSKDDGGFWSTVWGVIVRPRGTFKRLAEDGSAMKKGLLIWVLFFSLVATFFIIFLDKGYPGTTLSTIPFNSEAIYSISIWCPPTLTLIAALVTVGFPTLCILYRA